MKRIIVVLFSVLVALGITLGTGFALAEEGDHEHTSGEYEVTCGASPRFPVAGEETELTCTVLHDGIHEEGLAVTLLLARMEMGHDDHDEAVADDHDEAVADDHDEAVADDHDEAVADDHDEAENTEVGSVEIAAIETTAGVYVANYTFEQEGKYLGTAQIGEEQADFVVAVRSSPIAWFFILGLVGVSTLLAGVVVVVKTVRRTW